MSTRLSRLQGEYERLKIIFDGHEHIRIAEASGSPPDRYIVEYHLKGLVEDNGEIHERNLHRAEIVLGENYPREMPRCTMLTPIFHPNIDYIAICTKDIGSVGETLDQTIIFIGEMISFQSYNLQSPRNGDAARWTKENQERLPLDGVNLVPVSLLRGGTELAAAITTAAALKEMKTDTEAPPAKSAEVSPKVEETTVTESASTVQSTPTMTRGARQCANCGQTELAAGLTLCIQEHLTCEDCHLECGNCLLSICCQCVVHTCASCEQICCEDCVIACEECPSWNCLAHAAHCGGCARWKCRVHIGPQGLCFSCAQAA
jgi:ubiquitin-protein ligase